MSLLLIYKKLKVMILKNNKFLVKVLNLDSILFSQLSMVKLEIHLILSNNRKKVNLDLMNSLKINSFSCKVTISSKMMIFDM